MLSWKLLNFLCYMSFPAPCDVLLWRRTVSGRIGAFMPISGTDNMWSLQVLLMFTRWMSLGTFLHTVHRLQAVESKSLALGQWCWKRLQNPTPTPIFHQWWSPETDGHFKVTSLLFLKRRSIDNSCQVQWINVKGRLFACLCSFVSARIISSYCTTGNGLGQ